jgi:hypothetical protein
MQVSFVQRSQRLVGEKLWQSRVFLSGINSSKTVDSKWNIIKAILNTFLDIKGTTVHCEFIPQDQIVNQAYYLEILKWLREREAVPRERSQFLAQWLDSPLSQFSSSQEALIQAASGPTIGYWNGIPAISPRFSSEWLLALSKNK